MRTLFGGVLCALTLASSSLGQEQRDPVEEFFANYCHETPDRQCFDVYVEAETESGTVSGFIVGITADLEHCYSVSSEIGNAHADDATLVTRGQIHTVRYYDEYGREINIRR